MKSYLNQMKWNVLVVSTLYIVSGILLLSRPEEVLDTTCLLIGSVIMVGGLSQVLVNLKRGIYGFLPRLAVVFGALCALVGLFLILNNRLILTILPWMFGLLFLYDALLHLWDALDLYKSGWNGWLRYLLFSFVSVLFGAAMVKNPFGSLVTMAQVVGAVLLAEGIVHIMSAFFTAYKVNDFVRRQELEAAKQEALQSAKPEDVIEVTDAVPVEDTVPAEEITPTEEAAEEQ